MQLDVVIPTYNRSPLLREALQSLLDARVPAGLDVHITIVDNNSTDDTREVILAAQARTNGRVSYVFEKRQGRSAALNAGVAATSGSHVGFIDDDEQVDSTWYEQIFALFTSFAANSARLQSLLDDPTGRADRWCRDCGDLPPGGVRAGDIVRDRTA